MNPHNLTRRERLSIVLFGANENLIVGQQPISNGAEIEKVTPAA